MSVECVVGMVGMVGQGWVPQRLCSAAQMALTMGSGALLVLDVGEDSVDVLNILGSQVATPGTSQCDRWAPHVTNTRDPQQKVR